MTRVRHHVPLRLRVVGVSNLDRPRRARSATASAATRKRLTGVLHNALANESSPFTFVVFPLEKIAEVTMQVERRLFATERERYWVGRLNSLALGIQLRLPWEASFGLGSTLLALPRARSHVAE